MLKLSVVTGGFFTIARWLIVVDHDFIAQVSIIMIVCRVAAANSRDWVIMVAISIAVSVFILFISQSGMEYLSAYIPSFQVPNRGSLGCCHYTGCLTGRSLVWPFLHRIFDRLRFLLSYFWHFGCFGYSHLNFIVLGRSVGESASETISSGCFIFVAVSQSPLYNS